MTDVRQMRAVRFHDYGPSSVLVVDDVPIPEPKEGEVLVSVRAAGVNAIDWKYRAGYLKDFMPLELPHIPGFDVAGTVERVGDGVSDFSPGDDVFGRGAGTYAQYAIVPATALAHKPVAIGFEEAATLPIGGVTAWAGLFDAGTLEPGQHVLVQGGAGGVGLLAVQLAHWKGAHVSATTSAGNVDFVRSLGADAVIDYTSTAPEGEIKDMDVVLDTVGGEVTERSWGMLHPDGILVVIAGMPDAEEAAAHGVRTSGVRSPEVIRPVLEQLVALVESGSLTPHVGRVFALADAVKAHAAAETGHGRGRIVLQVASPD